MRSALAVREPFLEVTNATDMQAEEMFEPVLLREVIDEAVAYLQPRNFESSTFHVCDSFNDVSVMGNKELLKRILVSLIYNVCQANYRDKRRNLCVLIHKLRRTADKETFPQVEMSSYVGFTVTYLAPHFHNVEPITTCSQIRLGDVGVGAGLSVAELLIKIHGGIMVSRKQLEKEDDCIHTVCLPIWSQ